MNVVYIILIILTILLIISVCIYCTYRYTIMFNIEHINNEQYIYRFTDEEYKATVKHIYPDFTDEIEHCDTNSKYVNLNELFIFSPYKDYFMTQHLQTLIQNVKCIILKLPNKNYLIHYSPFLYT